MRMNRRLRVVPPEGPDLPARLPANKRWVRQGGLMRCCLATIGETETETKVGDTLDCKYEPEGNANLIVANDAVWEWNR